MLSVGANLRADETTETIEPSMMAAIEEDRLEEDSFVIQQADRGAPANKKNIAEDSGL